MNYIVISFLLRRLDKKLKSVYAECLGVALLYQTRVRQNEKTSKFLCSKLVIDKD